MAHYFLMSANNLDIMSGFNQFQIEIFIKPVLFPFGPPVYLDKMAEPFVAELDSLIEKLGGVPEFDASGQLAGRIKKQTHLTKHISKDVEECIINHCNRFYNHINPEIQAQMQIQSIWSNIQEAREYNHKTNAKTTMNN